MKISSFDLEQDILLIAEIGNNHEGSYALAEQLVGLAAEAGASAVKFQTFKTEGFVSRRDPARFERLKSFELSYAQFERLSELAHKLGLLFISTPLDLESAAFLGGIVDACKIASGDNNFYPLLERVAASGKPVILSSGLADLAQLKISREVLDQSWQARGFARALAVLHCVTCYPVPDEQANLRAITHLRDELKCTVGYSDHTLGVEACVLAVALGARIVEKHFTIDKNYSTFRDHQLSADPKEMAALARRIKAASAMLGSGRKVLQECERPFVKVARRSIVASRDLPEGAMVSRDSLEWLRPGDGLAPGEEDFVLGKILMKAVRRGEPILADMVRSREGGK